MTLVPLPEELTVANVVAVAPPDTSVFRTEPYALQVGKEWGHEVILTPAGTPYAAKLLHVRANHRLSLQYHDQKMETITLLSGRALLQCDNERGELVSIEMTAHMGYTIQPHQRHRLTAIDDCVFFEASTPETGNTVRLDDDYGRGIETEEMRARERNQAR